MLLSDWIERSGVDFGTSGARGLVSQMDDRICFLYTVAFLKYLEERGEFTCGTEVALGGDLRSSTPRIAVACAEAIRFCAGKVLPCGAISSPALASFAISRGIPSLMVTGSHIPEDRNGIKFTRRTGEIDKGDEVAIKAMKLTVPQRLFSKQGAFLRPPSEDLFSLEEGEAHLHYRRRALHFFGAEALKGLRLGFYQHSGVARDLIPSLLESMGAQVERLARSERFIPVDTEAIRPEDRLLAKEWAALKRFDAILSTDGDADRPLLADETGEWWRGDQLGLLTCRILGIEAVALPVSSTTAAELCGWFKTHRTRIGSPYVIEGMQHLEQLGYGAVAGFEANGGFLLQTPLERAGRRLDPLPTRDVVLPLVALLAEARRLGRPLSSLREELPPRTTASGRLKEFSSGRSLQLIERWKDFPDELEAHLTPLLGGVTVVEQNSLDGVRTLFSDGTIIHLRASGNAPEFRCYVECEEAEEAQRLLGRTLEWMESLRAQ